MLTEAIKSMGLKRAVVAENLGIGRAYLSGLESGKKKPSLELAVKIARLTGGAVPVESWVDPEVSAIPQPAATAAQPQEHPHVPDLQSP
ncbi:helix-turn-helix transcriptional regulator [Paracoccus sp. SSJ]|uniref:helix-turn-helix domain-containing protein n=1 Tax=Paracoccus sp. SSJ TaxID=3050636 RepID=UPI00254BC944|nr:helix-turn-helix transcriptional regulator [Paracoccus sp. SSJ]MDK8874708.1 helix-turn-helix transcriptional regulator [Paracoccus sp. SSJ]